MKKLFPEAPDVPQGVANRGIKIVEKHLRLHKVDRAKDLPEEAKVRLLRDLREFYDTEAKTKGGQGPNGQRGLWERIWEKIENFLSFSAIETDAPLIICPAAAAGACTVWRGST